MAETQRDAFWNSLYSIAIQDRDVILVIADMGAPALDRFRTDLPGQYIDVGIAEQQAIAVASGLALSGKNVYAYAIAPFISLRCYEFIRVDMAAMNLGVTLVGVGAGVSYDDSGPTHHAIEDLSVLRSLPNLTIYNVTDSIMARAMADLSHKSQSPIYIRLDRKQLPNIYSKESKFTDGLSIIRAGKDICLLATGNMVHRALAVSDRLAEQGVDACVVDIYKFPVNSRFLLNTVMNTSALVTIEEHALAGGMGSMVCETVCDAGLSKRILRLGMDLSNGYCYQYGGRDNIDAQYGLDENGITASVLSFVAR